MIPTHHHREPPTYREIGRCTLARYPGDPLPEWLGGGSPPPRLVIPIGLDLDAIRAAVPGEIFALDDPTLPTTEDRT